MKNYIFFLSLVLCLNNVSASAVAPPVAEERASSPRLSIFNGKNISAGIGSAGVIAALYASYKISVINREITALKLVDADEATMQEAEKRKVFWHRVLIASGLASVGGLAGYAGFSARDKVAEDAKTRKIQGAAAEFTGRMSDIERIAEDFESAPYDDGKLLRTVSYPHIRENKEGKKVVYSLHQIGKDSVALPLHPLILRKLPGLTYSGPRVDPYFAFSDGTEIFLEPQFKAFIEQKYANYFSEIRVQSADIDPSRFVIFLIGKFKKEPPNMRDIRMMNTQYITEDERLSGGALDEGQVPEEGKEYFIASLILCEGVLGPFIKPSDWVFSDEVE